jgi:hypothetical protein
VDLGEIGWMVRTGEHSSELLGSKKGRKFLDWVADCWLLKAYCAPFNSFVKIYVIRNGFRRVNIYVEWYLNCTLGSFHKNSGQSVNLTTHLHLVLRLRMCGAIHPFPHTSSWCGA